jgi:hypothetical protein
MHELELTWGRVLSVWWLVAWRGLVGSLLIGAAIGFVIGLVGFAAGVTLDAIQLISTVAGGLVGLLWAIVVVRMALKKKYGEFRLALVPR